MSIMGAIIAGGASLLGGKMGNAANAKEAAKNRSFQEEMANTSWQRGVEDMKKAGLSPTLAYNKGGAAVPSGSQAQQSDIATPAVNSALSAMQNKANVRLTEANAAKTEAETDNVEKAGRLIEAQIGSNTASAGQAEAQSKVLDMTVAKVEEEVKNLVYDRHLKGANLDMIQKQLENYDLTVQEKKAVIQQILQNTANAKWLEPGLRNQAMSENTEWGRSFRPYIKDAGSILNSAASMSRFGR